MNPKKLVTFKLTDVLEELESASLEDMLTPQLIGPWHLITLIEALKSTFRERDEARAELAALKDPDAAFVVDGIISKLKH